MGRLMLIAFRNLLSHKRRSLLLGLAITAVTLLLVLLTSVSNGIQSTMLRAATTVSTGHVNVGGFYKITSGQAAPVVTDYEPLMKLIQQKIGPSAQVTDRLRGWGKVVSATSSIQVGISGIDISKEPTLSEVVTIAKGDLNGLKREGTVVTVHGLRCGKIVEPSNFADEKCSSTIG